MAELSETQTVDLSSVPAAAFFIGSNKFAKEFPLLLPLHKLKGPVADYHRPQISTIRHYYRCLFTSQVLKLRLAQCTVVNANIVDQTIPRCVSGIGRIMPNCYAGTACGYRAALAC